MYSVANMDLDTSDTDLSYKNRPEWFAVSESDCAAVCAQLNRSMDELMKDMHAMNTVLQWTADEMNRCLSKDGGFSLGSRATLHFPKNAYKPSEPAQNQAFMVARPTMEDGTPRLHCRKFGCHESGCVEGIGMLQTNMHMFLHTNWAATGEDILIRSPFSTEFAHTFDRWPTDRSTVSFANFVKERERLFKTSLICLEIGGEFEGDF